MLSLQEAGLEILNNEPRSFYFLCGNEYGIKRKYIESLTKHYGKMVECNSLLEVVSSLSTKRIIPLPDTLYVIRYDEVFVKSLDKVVADKLNKISVPGTIIALYYDEPSATKLDKFFPDNTVRIDKVDDKFVAKYLKNEFKELVPELVDLLAKECHDYNQARIICSSINHCQNSLSGMKGSQILNLFYLDSDKSDNIVRLGIASRNFNYLIRNIQHITDYNDALYTILSTLLELEKLSTNSYANSDIKQYAKLWKIRDIYNMFNQTYRELEKSRSMSIIPENSLIYLFSLLNFSEIPDTEVL